MAAYVTKMMGERQLAPALTGAMARVVEFSLFGGIVTAMAAGVVRLQ